MPIGKRWTKTMYEDYLKYFENSPKFLDVDSYEQFDEFELLVTLNNGDRLLYHYGEKAIRYLNPNRRSNVEMDDDVWKKEFSWRLQSAFNNAHVSQIDLSEITGISEQTLSSYLNGRSIPSLRNAEKLAVALNCDISDLLNFPR